MAAQRERGGIPALPRETRWTRMWQPFWAVPSACVGVALVLGIVLPLLDDAAPWVFPFVFEGGPDGARSVLSEIAGATISVIGLVFSITMVLLQLASSQFTPRILGDFASSRIVQSTLGLFMAAFIFSLTVLRVVRGEYGDYDAFVPQGSVAAAYVLVLACVISFLMFINHIIRMIQVSHVLKRVGNRTMELAARMYPGLDSEQGLQAGPTWSPRPDDVWFDVIAERHGHIATIDYPDLVSVARDMDAVIALDVPIGQYIVAGQVIARVWGSDDEEQGGKRVRAALRVGPERSLTQDIEFGIRQMLDIGDRALSPSTNDPTTALEVVNELHRIFRSLVGNTSPSPYISDDDSTVRVIHRPSRVTELLEEVVRELTHYSGDTFLVNAGIQTMLADLEEASIDAHRGAIQEIRERYCPAPEAAEDQAR